MKDIKSMLSAFANAQKEGKKTALATLVQMEGTSYGRPHARFLVDEDGRLSGAVAGRVEGNALLKIMSAIKQQQNKLITFHPADPDDAKLISKFGYRRSIRLLIEPVLPYKLYNPMELLRQVANGRQDAVLVSLFAHEHDRHPGTSLLYSNSLLQSTLPLALQASVLRDAQETLQSKTSSFQQYHCGGGRCNALIEFVPMEMVMIVAGEGTTVHTRMAG